MSPASGARSWVMAVWIALAVVSHPDSSTAATAAAQAVAPRTAPDTRLDDAVHALSAGDAARAFELATAYLAQHPGDAGAQVLLARVHLFRDDLDAAYTQLERALRAHPRDVDVLYYLGLVTGQLAAVELERLVEQAPSSARAHQLRAESFVAQDRRADAEQAYEAALADKPDLLDALLGLARLKRIRLDCEGAVALYRKAETLRPTFDGAHGLGSCLLRMDQAAEALVQFERAVARDPRAAIARVGLGSALLSAGRTADAIASLERAVALEPSMGEAYYLLGRAYQAAGDRVRSQSAYEKAQQLSRDP